MQCICDISIENINLNFPNSTRAGNMDGRFLRNVGALYKEVKLG